jgi:hypothetical protein
MNIKRIIKTASAYLLSGAFVISMIAGTGCNNPKTIEDYPEPVSAVNTETETNTDTDTDTPSDEGTEAPKANAVEQLTLTDEQFEEFIAIPDPFEKTGQFQYNPTAIPEYYARRFREKPAIIAVAKAMMEAAYNAERGFDVPPEDVLDIDDYIKALSLAEMSSPIVDSAQMKTEGFQDYEIIYMPEFVVNETEQGIFFELNTEQTSYEHASQIIDQYTDYIQDIVNKNVSKDDSDIEKARKVYEALVKDLSYSERNLGIDMNYSMEDVQESFNSEARTIENTVVGKSLTQDKLALLYQSILTQLNIECMTVTATGLYHEQGVEKLDKEMGEVGYDTWNVIYVDGKAYNCDLAYEIITYEDDKTKYGEHCDPQMKYFGMSDKTRGESFSISRSNLYLYDEYEGMGIGHLSDMVPECLEDYKK